MSCIEAWKKEAYGVLVGHKEKDIYTVEHVIPHQEAERDYNWVKPKKRTEKRIRWFLTYLPHLTTVGEFHSHVGKRHAKKRVIEEEMADTQLSEEDKIAIQKEEISLIVGISKKLKEVAWGYNRNGTISGTTDEHYVKLAAYYKDKKGKIRNAELICPFALGFGVIRR